MTLTRVPYEMPEYLRVLWGSAEAKALWETRIQHISAAWTATEMASIGGVRPCGRFIIPFEAMPALQAKILHSNVQMVILGTTYFGGGYSARPANGVHNAYTVVVAQGIGAARTFKAAWDKSDDQAIGELLGYPPCCISFFKQMWNTEKWMDTTYPMAVQSQKLGGLHDPHTLQVNCPSLNNIMLRWLGLRFVPHLPCSFNCKGTKVLGQAMRQTMEQGFKQEAQWLEELLSAPMEWSQKFGLGELKHPLFKLSFKSDATVEKLTVQKSGTVIPELAATGVKFPYTGAISEIKPLTFHRSPEVYTTTPDPALDWQENGFSTEKAMQIAHGAIEQVMNDCVAINRSAAMLDFGCGNGLLVRKFTDRAYGVEVLESRAALARKRGVTTYCGNISTFISENLTDLSFPTYFQVVFLGLARLTNLSQADRNHLNAWLRSHARRVVVYCYDDLLQEVPFIRACERLSVPIHSNTSVQIPKTAGAALINMEAL